MADASAAMDESLALVESSMDDRIVLYNDAAAAFRKVKGVISGIAVKKLRLDRELQEKDEQLRALRERLQEMEAMNSQAEMQRNGGAPDPIVQRTWEELMVAKERLAQNNRELEEKDEELRALRYRLQEMEALNTRADQHQIEGSPDHIQPRVVTASEELMAVKEELMALKRELKEAKEALAVAKGLIDQKNMELKVVREKLELMENHAMRELVNNPITGQTSGVLVCEDDDLQAVREELIKGFLNLGREKRKLGIKEMGKLDEKALKAACIAKLPHEKVHTAFYQLYSSWQQQLSDLSWNPFKTVISDGNFQVIVNVEDDKLQELKRAWGEGAHNVVVNALMEMKEYSRLHDRSITYELWNHNEGRKATTRECVAYMCNQVKQLSVVKRRKTRRTAGIE
ncbi:hypothetical protein ACP70R_032358 [Stipagrostis hirtigluma subsp. patula]